MIISSPSPSEYLISALPPLRLIVSLPPLPIIVANPLFERKSSPSPPFRVTIASLELLVRLSPPIPALRIFSPPAPEVTIAVFSPLSLK